uniref:Uncharacterized protein n=1 Tax=Arundo donax TaxID=35708 RepID=A0A0A9BPA1_ARUDO
MARPPGAGPRWEDPTQRSPSASG